jgi:hypothetical protein
MGSRIRIGLAIATGLLALAAVVAVQADNGPFTTGDSGFDISWPQCPNGDPGGAFDFAVIGVTGGRAFRENSCLASQYASVSQNTGVDALHMNLNYRIGRTAKNGDDGPMGHCGHRDNACKDFNYGYNAAQFAFDYAIGEGVESDLWWIDIETANSWSRKADKNLDVIRGAVKFFDDQGIIVGIYSTSAQWGSITGSDESLGLPIWIAGAADATDAASVCTNEDLYFAGGAPWLVQYVEGGLDHDYAC